MSDLSISLTALERSRTQLSPRSYFDEGVFGDERALIFEPGPRYAGHELWTGEAGNYHTLPHEGEGRALVRDAQGLRLVSNVCRHRQALMLRGRGQTRQHIVCPIHRWTYGLDGQLAGAPHFESDPCLHLNTWPLHCWQGLLFDDAGRDVRAALQGLSPGALDFSGFVLDRIEMHECDYNWKTFIEVYLEDYHVGPFHPGLGGFVTCDDLRWQFGEHYSVQTVGLQQALTRPGSATYRRWHEALLAYSGTKLPAHGAIWLTLYPSIMVEWYPQVLVVSTLHARGPRTTLNMVEFYYPEEVAAFEREFVEAQQAAYMETCVEDDEIAQRMDAGRQALMARGDDEFGPYQSPMEDGMRHFHQWYRREMAKR
ncbi:MAG TPA: aromatic ring-hydroxylating dioxygenase subunit alpha [Rubrivivax sp.]|nr:aromatic ring-hydroxylating dioxygenase subunit alpha [Rubrivivax sp.]